MRPVTSCPAGITTAPDSSAIGESRVARKVWPAWLRDESILSTRRMETAVPEGIVTGLGAGAGAATLGAAGTTAATAGTATGFCGADGTTGAALGATAGVEGAAVLAVEDGAGAFPVT